MNVPEETILKNIFVTEKALKRDAKKYTDKLVVSKVFCFSKTPRDYNEISGILERFLKQIDFRWVNLMFYAQSSLDGSSVHPHAQIKIFVFGKRMFILENIKDITKRIVAGDRWMEDKVGISSLPEFSIKYFI